MVELESLQDELDWIRRVVVADDHCAFSLLVGSHQSAIRQFLRRLTRQDMERADDLAQETFLKAYLHIRSYRQEGRFRSWLFKIAYQIFLGDQRRLVRTPMLESDLSLLTDKPSTVDERLSVDKALNQLQTQEKTALMLHYEYNMTHSEIASILKRPLGSVKSTIRRSLEKMRTLMKKEREP